MRILIHMPPPWAPSGYGVQGAILARSLRDAGHDVGISAFGGFLAEGFWEDIPLYACGTSPYGTGHIWYNYSQHKADVMITIMDFWVLDPSEWDQSMTVVPWVPVDTQPLGLPDKMMLKMAMERCNMPMLISMSTHGHKMLEGAGFENVKLIPHMTAPEFTPGDRAEWRELNGIPADAFVISMIGVNAGYPDRKAFDTTMCAFQVISEAHDDVRLYLHTMAQNPKDGLDLLRMMSSLGLDRKVGFCDQLKRLSDHYTTSDIASIYRGSDVLTAASRGEGFGVPIIESLACGTPVIASNCTSMPELVGDAGWLCHTQPQWSKLHASWWQTPIISSLVSCYKQAYDNARSSKMRQAAADRGKSWHPDIIIPRWVSALESIG